MIKKIMPLFLLVLVLACKKDNSTEPEKITPSSDSSEYFPMAAGNEWRYYEPGRQDATRSIRVWAALNLADSTFFIYGNKLESADTLYQDQWGRVYKRWNGHTQLWLDFSVDNEGTYQYRLSGKLDYTVTVKKNQSVAYDEHTFDNCISISFDVPDLVDEEMLDAALAERPDEIEAFFLGDDDRNIEGFADIVNDQIRTLIGTNGQLEGEKESAQSRINDLEAKIEQENTRLDRKYELLTKQFIELDRYMNQMTNLSSYLASQFDSISNAWGGTSKK